MSKRLEAQKIKVGITIGDIGGIGPELVLKAFQDPRLKDRCVPILYGSSKVLNIYRKVLEIEEKFNYSVIPNANSSHYKKFNIIECVPNMERVEIGKPSDMGGQAAFKALKLAIEDAQHGSIQAMVTLPLDKASMQKELPDFKGHTEMLAEAFSSDDQLMMMVYEDLKVGLVTNHLSLQNVPRNISENIIVRKAELMHESLMKDFNIPKPLIAILGLNPHAGDHGLLGKEEEEIIIPAIDTLRKKGIMAEGPYPADGLFGSMTYRKFDGILAMYHDQGLVPFKLIAGYGGVNFTAGIPFVRTSPDHGVAYDIAGKNLADPESLRAAIYTAVDVYHHRSENEVLMNNRLQPNQKYQPPAQDEDVPELVDEDETMI